MGDSNKQEQDWLKNNIVVLNEDTTEKTKLPETIDKVDEIINFDFNSYFNEFKSEFVNKKVINADKNSMYNEDNIVLMENKYDFENHLSELNNYIENNLAWIWAIEAVNSFDDMRFNFYMLSFWKCRKILTYENFLSNVELWKIFINFLEKLENNYNNPQKFDTYFYAYINTIELLNKLSLFIEADATNKKEIESILRIMQEYLLDLKVIFFKSNISINTFNDEFIWNNWIFTLEKKYANISNKKINELNKNLTQEESKEIYFKIYGNFENSENKITKQLISDIENKTNEFEKNFLITHPELKWHFDVINFFKWKLVINFYYMTQYVDIYDNNWINRKKEDIINDYYDIFSTLLQNFSKIDESWYKNKINKPRNDWAIKYCKAVASGNISNAFLWMNDKLSQYYSEKNLIENEKFNKILNIVNIVNNNEFSHEKFESIKKNNFKTEWQVDILKVKEWCINSFCNLGWFLKDRNYKEMHSKLEKSPDWIEALHHILLYSKDLNFNQINELITLFIADDKIKNHKYEFYKAKVIEVLLKKLLSEENKDVQKNELITKVLEYIWKHIEKTQLYYSYVKLFSTIAYVYSNDFTKDSFNKSIEIFINYLENNWTDDLKSINNNNPLWQHKDREKFYFNIWIYRRFEHSWSDYKSFDDFYDLEVKERRLSDTRYIKDSVNDWISIIKEKYNTKKERNQKDLNFKIDQIIEKITEKKLLNKDEISKELQEIFIHWLFNWMNFTIKSAPDWWVDSCNIENNEEIKCDSYPEWFHISFIYPKLNSQHHKSVYDKNYLIIWEYLKEINKALNKEFIDKNTWLKNKEKLDQEIEEILKNNEWNKYWYIQFDFPFIDFVNSTVSKEKAKELNIKILQEVTNLLKENNNIEKISQKFYKLWEDNWSFGCIFEIDNYANYTNLREELSKKEVKLELDDNILSMFNEENKEYINKEWLWYLTFSLDALYSKSKTKVDTENNSIWETIWINKNTIDDIHRDLITKRPVIKIKDINLLYSLHVLNNIEKGRSSAYNVFQPLYSLKNDKIIKFEALLRIEHNNNFYPHLSLFDITNKIWKESYITKKVILNSIDILKNNNTNISINFTKRDLLDDDLIDFLIQSVDNNNIDASNITIEILEEWTWSNKDVEKINDSLILLRKASFKTALDDFWSNWANLDRLDSIEENLDFIKFDANVIKNLKAKIKIWNSFKKNNRKIARAEWILDLINKTKNEYTKTVAEYVEDEYLFNKCTKLWIDLVQWYYIWKPSKELDFVPDFKKAKPENT